MKEKRHLTLFCGESPEMKEIRAVLQRLAARMLSNAGSLSKCNSEMRILQNRRSNGLISISEIKFRLTTFYRIFRQKSRAFARRICGNFYMNRAECTVELELYCINLIKNGKYLPIMARKGYCLAAGLQENLFLTANSC